MESILHVKGQLEELRDELEESGNLMVDWQKKGEEKLEDLTEVASLMAGVAAYLGLCVTAFLENLDIEKDCRQKAQKRELVGARGTR